MSAPTGSRSRKLASYGADLQVLYEAFLQLKTRDECERFMLDLCTPAEMLDFAERLKIARLLEEKNLSYRKIHEETGVSITTIGRVARFLTQEPHQGYRLVLKRLKNRPSKNH